jgi:hypothetical protein
MTDQVKRGAAEIPGCVQRHIRPVPAVQPVHAGEAIEPEQVGIGKLEVEAVLVRKAHILAVAGLRPHDDLRDRLDELRSPGAGVAHERPAELERRLWLGLHCVDDALRPEVRLLVE